MTPSEAISVSCEQKLWWQHEGVTASEAWFCLTGIRGARVDWALVEAWIIRWLVRKQEEPERIAA